jgi:glutamate racemase
MTIGVFDSGVGGLSVANAIKDALPEYEILLREDKKNIPYGTKSPQELLVLVTPILQSMVDDGCKVIVIACNTVTTTLIEELRKQIGAPLIAVEPMVKPAVSLSKTGVIAVCATPTTLESARYAWLKSKYAKSVKVLEPDCGDWATMIEEYEVDEQVIDKRIKEVLVAGADVIVLACTHYHWIEDQINKLADKRAIVIQPEAALIEQLKRVIEQLV